jgi:prepilin-type N-terminal cleavage/methylation domain-containing protein
MRTNRHGYTLVEIVVVAAIVALIVALLFPVFGPSREKARQAVCVSNLHQIGRAIQMYVADWDGVDASVGMRSTHAQLGLPPMRQALEPYLKDERAEVCPSVHDPKRRGRPTSYIWPVLGGEGIDPTFLDMIALRGGDYPAVACDQHNARTDFIYMPRWETKTIIVLRLNQRVQVELLPVHVATTSEW